MFDHNLLAGILAVRGGDSPIFWIVMIFVFVVSLIIRSLKASARKDDEAATRVRRTGSVRTLEHSLQERHESCARVAAEAGLEFHPDDPWNLPAKYSDFELFTLGHSRRVSNVMAGDVQGRPVLLFDYQYLTGTGPDEMTHAFQAALMELPIVAPRLELRRENDFGRLASWTGHDDLSFANPVFARRYVVRCDEPRFAHDVLHAGLQQYLGGCRVAPGVMLRGPIMVLTFDGRGDVALFPQLMAVGVHIIGSLPPQVVAERGAGASEDGHFEAK